MTEHTQLSDRVVLVNDSNGEIGVADKVTAHSGAGMLHREFSVFAYDGPVSPDPGEVSEWCWRPFSRTVTDCTSNPDRFTPWFRLVAHRLPALYSDFKRQII